MKKALQLAWKDMRIRVNDRAAFIYLLLTPMVLTLILGAAFGGLGGGSSGPTAIPVAVTNLDDGELGQALVNLLAVEVGDLLDTQVKATEQEARRAVDEDDFAAAVIIPAGFTGAMIPSHLDPAQGMALLGGQSQPGTVNVTVYTDPTRPISSGIVRAVVEGFAWQVSSGVVAGTVSVEHLLKSGKLDLADIMSYVQAMSDRLWEADARGEQVWVSQLISLRPETVAGGSAGAGVDWIIAYYAPSMAIMFLSFGVTQGARTILQEERTGTLGRLLTTPTRAASILGGKLLSTYVAGLLQFTILVGASSLLFGLSWGSPLAVVALSLVLVGAMTSLGTVMAAFARSEGQVNTWGVAVLLVFSAVSGNMMPRFGFPAWLKAIGLLTPNAWALEGFTKLGTGGGLGDIWVELGALSAMAVLLFGLGVVRLGRRMTL